MFCAVVTSCCIHSKYVGKSTCTDLWSCAEMKDILSTSAQRASLAKYRDNIASAMQAQFSNILHEASFFHFFQGEGCHHEKVHFGIEKVTL